jgi:hypothetical protein
MTLNRRRCNWCGDKLTGKQKRYCGNPCRKEAYVAGPSAAGALSHRRHLYAPHGTTAAWRQHYRLGEHPCRPCRIAAADADTRSNHIRKKVG